MTSPARSRWVLVLALAVAGLAGPQGASCADLRQPVALTAVERDWVLQTMRAHVAALQSISAGVGSGDLRQAELAAQSMGLEQANSDPSRPPSVRAKLPAAWVTMVVAMHRGFDAVAQAAQANEDAAHLSNRVGGVMAQCVACHSLYRIELQP
jgi:cytochrome c556